MHIPLISIIIPIYNAEKYLKKNIDSILKQTYKNFELLLINDGSTDSSLKICTEYAKTDVRIKIFSQKNSGPSSARNKGLEYATGEYVCFIDADDYVEESYLSSFINALSNNTDIVIGGYYCQRFNGNEILEQYSKQVECIADISSTIMSLKETNLFGFLWNKLYRKQIFDDNQIRFDTSLFSMEDEHMLLQYFSKAKKICIIPNCHYHYSEPDWENKYTDIHQAILSLYKSYTRSQILFPNNLKLQAYYLILITQILIKQHASTYDNFKYYYMIFYDYIYPNKLYGKKIYLLFSLIRKSKPAIAYTIFKLFSFIN